MGGSLAQKSRPSRPTPLSVSPQEAGPRRALGGHSPGGGGRRGKGGTGNAGQGGSQLCRLRGTGAWLTLRSGSPLEGLCRGKASGTGGQKAATSMSPALWPQPHPWP